MLDVVEDQFEVLILRVILDLLNQVVNVLIPCDRFTIAFGTPEMLKSMFFLIDRKVELVRV